MYNCGVVYKHLFEQQMGHKGLFVTSAGNYIGY